MKITDVEAIALAIPLRELRPASSWRRASRKQIVVRVQTDAGLVGTGEAFGYGAPLAVCAVIQEMLAPLLRGQDPTRIEHLVDQLHRGTSNYGRRGLAMFAISGIEIALWDLLGRSLGAPVYQLLGGALRPSLPAYASLVRYDSPADVGEACGQYAAQGFRFLKLHQIDVPSLAAAREAVGDDLEIMVDTNCPWTPAEAIAVGRAMEPYRPYWLEEPVWPPEDYAGLAEVAAALDTPLACGENESTLYGFREIIDHGAATFLQPSVTKVGGISELRKIGALAAAANLAVVPHSFYHGPGLAATLHVAATFGGRAPIEFSTIEYELPFLTEPIAAQDGFVNVPTGPGLGVEINEEAIRRFRYRG